MPMWFLDLLLPPLWLVIALVLCLVLVCLLVYGLCAAASLEPPAPRDPVVGIDQYRAEAHARVLKAQNTRRTP